MYLLSMKLSFIHSFFMLIFSITADFRFKLPVWISYKLILQVVVLVFERMDSNNNSPGHQRSEANREEVRRCLHKLLGWLQENRELLQNIDNQHLTGIMEQADDLFHKVDSTKEMMIDSKIMLTITSIARIQALQMSANLVNFRPEDFAMNLKKKMGLDSDSRVTARSLVRLGRKLKPQVHRSPALTFMHGALATSDPGPKEVKERRKPKPNLSSALRETVTVTRTAGREDSSTTTEELVVAALRSLVRAFRDNGDQPVDYFPFVLHPTSFAASVENMFHVSFLVKEGRAGLGVDPSTGRPSIWPVAVREQSQASGSSSQVVINLTVRDWRQLGKDFNEH